MAFRVAVKFQCFILFLWLQSTAAEIPIAGSRPMGKPGCLDKCGRVVIPYPFGIGEGCFRNRWFEIRCSNNNTKPMYGNLTVTKISILGGSLTTEVSISTDCSHNQMRNFNYSAVSQFTFSATKNKLTAIGCNTYAYLGLKSKKFTAAGCMSMCNAMEDPTDGSCNGIGCCQVSVPAGLREFTMTVGRLNELRTNSSFNPCTYAFLVEKNSFNFSSSYLKNFKNNGTEGVPVAIDWNVGGTETCEEAVRNSTSYACGPNTKCNTESIKGTGYRCQCKRGYEGNPYLNSTTGGHCEDIDECEEASTCTWNCINKIGGYECGCPKGKGLFSITNSTTSHTQVFQCSVQPPRSGNLVVIIVSGIGVSIVIIVLLWMGYWLYNRFHNRKQLKLKRDNFKRNGGLLLKQKITSNGGKIERAAKIFVAEELENATDNYNPSRIIGKGGFGTVFKGMSSDGEIVAIKKSTLVDETQVGQFINEVAILSQINHRHIVKLLGCCLETQVPLLVYEFVPNGTLSYHLHEGEGDNESLLSWKDRVRIASEIAGALAYLHSDASMPIFHRDIKTTNILLDEKYKAKVSDFGISRSVPIDSTHLTTLVQGTFGYLDPEYFHSCQFTDKSDVYSFGIVLVELLTGEKAISQTRYEEEKSLALYFIKSLEENRLSVLLDAQVLDKGDKDDVMVVAKLAKRCLKLNGKRRPTMKEVSLILGGLHEKLSIDSA
ncbi:hypothetical protein MKX03_018175 [Papaver bracteatum]|nr:hypothetical protein MKX03_018175 [Papaver bracteatum]